MNRGVCLLGHPNVSAVTTNEDISFTLDRMSKRVEALSPIIEEKAPHLIE